MAPISKDQSLRELQDLARDVIRDEMRALLVLYFRRQANTSLDDIREGYNKLARLYNELGDAAESWAKSK